MKNVLKYLLLALIAVSQLFACGGSDDEKTPADNFDVQFTVPGSVDVTEGSECTFAVSGGGKSPLTTDTFILESDAGISYVCPIVNTSSDSFTVRLADGCETGYYKVFVKRDARKKSFGRIYINIVEDIDFKPDAGTTVYGIVSSAGVGVENVVVSDGAEVTVTNEKGIYQLKSAKKWGYVFISVPSGYEVPSVGVLPQFHRALKNSADVVERADFKLEKVDGQDSYKIFMLGDMHLANRTGDLGQFAQFTSDLTDYMTRHKGEKMYALTLGDMTWDLYWYSNSYYFPQYLNTVNSQIKNLQIFHTMGNHDNDFQTRSDYDAAVKYVDQICPTYYSFNIGKVHYVVMDDIDCSSYDGSTSRNYVKSLSAEQLDWLAKDLSYVAKTTPVVVAMHAQVFYPTTSGFKIDHDQVNTLRLFDILDGYTVRFVTGHTHKLFNVTPDAPIVDGHNFREYNSGSVCASWWWSGNLTPGIHIGTDGTPGGYGIWDVTGTDFQCLYKSTGWPEEYQFRSYDLNNVHFSMADVPLMPSDISASVKNAYMQYVNAYPQNNDNEVLINIWNWNSDWTLSVVDENRKTLPYTEVWAYDPLHIAALSVKRFNNAGLKSTPSFITDKFTHFFKVKADDADTDLVITVKDEFGNEWTENMQRPKAFSTDAYRRK
ncbi:calcineurin-like phosphoesterase C-terminal domain-containing protein [Alistipes shahii]|uniref:calcineurin-like phosphoesterase C-terminal domain-containing protein n=1 Tax=Alistipes shahii TaxID=328814 RepID=UPI001C3792F3|nr:calcineurin-like phosphoesterase family protein [Alistipes shahii]MBV4293928.1 calcineurin-like phosphoesterase family protein [Alistipes shahii]